MLLENKLLNHLFSGKNFRKKGLLHDLREKSR